MEEIRLLFDVSLILTLHNEGKYLRRTLLSLKEATLYAQGFGISVELVAVLDRANQLTKGALSDFDLSDFSAQQVIHVDNGSLGLSRNSGAAVAGGKYLSMCDGDDLISYNFIANMYFDAEKKGPLTALFPQFLVGFGDAYHVGEYLCLKDMTPLALLNIHPFVSRIFGHRDLFSVQKYADVRLSPGYAYEDWHFHCEITARGYILDVSQDTILFYRRRTDSLLAQADTVSVKQIPPSELFKTPTFLKLCQEPYQRVKNSKHHFAGYRTRGANILRDPVTYELIAAANKIDPAVDVGRYAACDTYVNTTWFRINIGMAYFDICKIINGRIFDDVFIFPFFGGGGAELYALKIVQQLLAQNLSSNILFLFGEPIEKHIWLDQLPASVVTVDLASLDASLSDADLDVLSLKTIESCAPNARIHVRQSRFGERFFRRFRTVLQTHHCIFYRFSDMVRIENDYRIMIPGGSVFISENLDYFHSVIADNETVIGNDQSRLGVQDDKWHCLRVPHVPKVDRRAAIEKTRRAAAKILWASRLAAEKRPSLIPAIARKLLHERPEITLCVFGADAFGEFDPRQLSGLSNVSYGGPFSNFEQIAADDFACFAYTSMFDGMPNILLEAISMGIPVIAPDVGGIAEMIVDRETGILLPSLVDNDEMATQYTKAIIEVVDSPDLRAQFVDNALMRLRQHHSLEMFAQRVSEIFRLEQR